MGNNMSTINLFQTKPSYIRHVNSIFLPSGILREPYVDEASPPALNFAGLGHLLGHEMMQAFDQIGRKWDEEGRLNNMWSPFAEAEYLKRVASLKRVHQFRSTIPTTKLVAEYASLPVVFAAFSDKTSRKVYQYLQPPVNFTDIQLFFVNFCFKTCSRLGEIEDGFSSAGNRCNALLRNFRPFSDAFKCKARDPMNAENRIDFWFM